MKNKLKVFFVLLLCFPAFLLCGCKPKETAALNIDYYFDSDVNCSFFGSKVKGISLESSNLTLKKPNPDYLDRYAEIILNAHADKSRVYHLYIEYIKFYVYTNENKDSDLIVNVTVSNVISEDEVGLELPTEENRTLVQHPSMRPTANGSTEFVVKINKVVATFTDGIEIKFDILNNDIYAGSGNTADDSNTFMWMIYGLEIHGEPRVYTTTELN